MSNGSADGPKYNRTMSAVPRLARGSTSEFGDVANEKRDEKVGFVACMLPYTTALAFE